MARCTKAEVSTVLTIELSGGECETLYASLDAQISKLKKRQGELGAQKDRAIGPVGQIFSDIEIIEGMTRDARRLLDFFDGLDWES
jgi:hypothetical protein